jgi:hypothetical protein
MRSRVGGRRVDSDTHLGAQFPSPVVAKMVVRSMSQVKSTIYFHHISCTFRKTNEKIPDHF